jgi:tetratricopeptide (TPR) repeat protein
VEDEPAAEAATAPPDDQLRALRRQLGRAATTQELALAVSGAVELAESYPASPAAQFLAAEAAYRTARWGEAVRFFEAGGDPDGSQPLLLFYKAVALFELGEADAALAYLERALPKLRKTDFVKSYAERIQAAAENAG